MRNYTLFAKEMLAKMTLKEKVAQLSQKVAGYRCFTRDGEEFTFSKEFDDFLKEYGPMGAISNILRADAFTRHDWNTGIEPRHRVKVANALQKRVLEHSRLQIPVLLEVEANHGIQALGSVMFPTNLGIGCTFNPELYRKIMKTVGKEMRLSANHMAFTTMLDMARDPRWGRTEEFFSEDPYLAAQFTEKGVLGYKSEGPLLCCKHYCATGDGFGGINVGEVSIGHRELHDIHLPPAEKAVKAGADVVMAAYNVIDGIPGHMNAYLLRTVLREELGFEGIVLSDGFGVQRAIGWMGYDMERGSAAALKAGVDLSLADTDGAYLHLEEACKKGYIDESLIDAAVTRILEKKYEIGLFDNPYFEDTGALAAYLKSGEQRKLAYEAAAESAVLLKNNGVLPLSENTKIALIGAHADNIYYQLGDYSAYQKQGETCTVREALARTFSSVSFTNGWDFRGAYDDFDHALQLAAESDVVIVTAGGSTAKLIDDVDYDPNTGAVRSASRFLDCGEGMDVSDIKLPGNQTELIERLRETGKPVVVLLMQGRPYEITRANAAADAVLAVWYPGVEGATAICDLLTGKVNPSGKLSVSIPAASTCLPAYYNRLADADYSSGSEWTVNTYSDHVERILYPFGYGLSYSAFQYNSMEVRKTGVNRFAVDVTVENISDRPGKETVLLYIHGSGNTVRRRVKELKGFRKIDLGAHEQKTVTFPLGYDELKVYSVNEIFEVEQATVTLYVGPLKAEIQTEPQRC